MPDSKVFLIDANGLCYRAFYAVRTLVNSKGQPTNAVFGFCNILRKLMRDFEPQYMVSCFDVGRKTYRQEKYPDYKIQRQIMPEPLQIQIPIIREVLKAYQIPMYQKEGFEADDVIATLARRLSPKAEVVIVSDDKDLSQLMDARISLFSPRQDRILTNKDIQEKFGVSPSMMVDLIALAGDVSDNISGVQGIGQVSAVKLLQTYGSLDEIYKHLDEIKPSGLQEKLRMGQGQAQVSHELALLNNDVPIEADLDDLKLANPNKKRLYEIFSELEFRKFASELSEQPQEAFVEIPQVDFIEIKEDQQTVTVTYDLKSFYKKHKRFFEGKVFDVFLARYLVAGGVNRAEIQASSTEGDLRGAYEKLKKQIVTHNLDFLFYEVEMPLSKVLYEMESNGVQLDLGVFKTLSLDCEMKINEVQGSLFKIAGVEFNVNSPKQLSEVLFERLKLPVVKKIKTGFSTDEEVLTKLAAKHPLPALILEYRQIAKLKSTYIDALPQMVDSKGRVHASFNQTGAETGRLSSNNPNLQNIPIRADLGRQIRKAFISFAKDHVLLSADYSQIELRLLAHCSKDENLIKAFKADEDIHCYTASLMFDVSEDKVDEKMRYAAKRINFGIIYGMSAFGLAKDLNISQAQAQDFIDKYFLRYPKVREFMDYSIGQAQEHGFVETLFHRRRYLPEIKSANIGLRQFAQRQAINAPLQGTAADIIKLAMVRIDQSIRAKKLYSTMIMTVHDELVFDVPVKEQEQMASLVKHDMETVIKLSVPLKASLKIGFNWFQMESL